MVDYSRNYVETIMNLVLTVPKWMVCLYHANQSHEVPLSFMWLQFSSFGWDVDMKRIRSDKTISLGMPKELQGNIQGRSKQLSLGMPRKASPLSSSFISNFTWSYIFIRHMICVFLGDSIYFSRIFLLLFRIMFCIFYFNKSGIDSLYYAYVTSIHVAVWKQKVYRWCKNSLEKSENGIMLNLFEY